MPFIIPPQSDNRTATTTTIEKFNLLVEKYKHVIDSDATARCMIGFAAANIIRNDGHMDLYSIENWLESIDTTAPLQDQQVSVSEDDDSVDKIMSVLTDTTSRYCHGNPLLQDQVVDSAADDTCDEFAAVDPVSSSSLNRYVSRGSYTSSDSYPAHVYIPARIHVNHPLGNLFLPLESSC
ncbi:hypothetical protein FB192DRAFT_1407364 [Mucor lusitanicus]|uniref:Uncharacterized protein n=2 Tax=Mucor circinelloides f. lusitanicus TaxID=29924 RepID=A0A168GD14_MUCCL|nr:hypothetical protein FB192DRAFT_1407364 [Mucor lusitanicus]OAC97564.1 hypothetical protein MUCCIDRAFT_86075 [Mucor lusitanicus CBS 277.49]